MEAKLVNQHAAIGALCREFGVSRLEVFGSASIGGFDPASSDYDFIARFSSRPGVSMARRFLGFSDALEALLERKVDLMTDHAIANPYLRAAVNASRAVVYAETPSEALV
jgi:predicted nucleotidyltransferase